MENVVRAIDVDHGRRHCGVPPADGRIHNVGVRFDWRLRVRSAFLGSSPSRITTATFILEGEAHLIRVLLFFEGQFFLK